MEQTSSQHSELAIFPLYFKGFFSVPVPKWSWKITKVPNAAGKALELTGGLSTVTMHKTGHPAVG